MLTCLRGDDILLRQYVYIENLFFIKKEKRMVTLLLVIFVLGLIATIIWGCINDWWNPAPIILTIIVGVAVVSLGIWEFCEIDRLANATVIDQKIEMYEEENEKIEAELELIVKEYMKYEKETYESFKNESPTTVVSLFPELRSDTLVQQLMETYSYNSAQIKSLKSQKINLSSAKWRLYFGH